MDGLYLLRRMEELRDTYQESRKNVGVLYIRLTANYNFFKSASLDVQRSFEYEKALTIYDELRNEMPDQEKAALEL
jgi:hypothetical protein